MKKKILYIAEAFGGGVFTYFTELANAVAEEYEVLIAYAKRAETPENFERFFRSDIRFVEILNFQRSVNPLQDFKAMQEIRHLVREYDPDIIHLRQVFAEEWRLIVKNTESIIRRMAMLF